MYRLTYEEPERHAQIDDRLHAMRGQSVRDTLHSRSTVERWNES